MTVSRHEIVSRGLQLRCPNCGAKTLFPARSYRINRHCPRCGLVLDRGEGFFLGPMVINYGIAVFGFIVPCIVLWATGAIPGRWAAILAVAACVAMPVALYRLSWSLWFAVYFWFLPERLDAKEGSRQEHTGD